MAPAVFFILVVVVVPFVLGFGISFTDWDGVSLSRHSVGLRNYAMLFMSDEVLAPFLRTLLFATLATLSINAMGLALALIVNHDYKGHNFHRTIFFFPAAINTVLAAFIWNFIYGSLFPHLFGVANAFSNRAWAIPAIAVVATWVGSGINMVIFLASLQAVPEALYESALIDGAGPARRFFRITLPMIMQAFTVNITLTFTNYLASFGIVLATTGGGPIRSSETIGIYIMDNLFTYNRAGFGQAAANVFLVFLMATGTLLSSIFRTREVAL
jgi:raffinose/stachyose/melibiose transport system permease protein